MAAQQLDQFVLPLFAQGMLGRGFRELQGVEKDNPGIIKHFFGVADNCIWELTRVVDMPVPIYSCIFHHCNKLKGSCQKI